ncbi:major facilitator superfamily domain-containing protein [Xylaria scruposa]|nr:major facilitator superfamily domain-containing protein [Xylaria scruposa]
MPEQHKVSIDPDGQEVPQPHLQYDNSTLVSGSSEKKTLSEKASLDDKNETPRSEDQSPENAEYPKGLKLVCIVLALMLSVLLTSLDLTIVATVIPKITDEFHGLDKASWYGSAYFLTSGSLQASWGKAFKYFDLKWTFLTSIVIFELGSLLCGVSPNSDALIVGRAIAGTGAAGMGTGCYTIIAYVVEPVKRPTFTGIIGLSYCFASVIGPLIGGVISSTTTWRWAFYLNLPVGAIAVIVIILLFRTPPAAKPTPATWKEKFLQFDVIGVTLIIGALISFSLATQYGGQTKPWRSSTVIGLLVGFVLLVSVFIVWQWYAGERGMLIPRLVTQRHIAAGSAFAFLFGGSYFVSIYYLPIYFQSINDASPILSGVDTLPLVIATTVSIISSGIFVTKTGHVVPLQVASTIVATVGAGLIYTLGIGTGIGNWIGYQIIAALGWGAGFQIPVVVAQGFADPADIPSVTAIILFFLNVGGGLLINSAQCGFVNTIIRTLATSAPEVDPSKVIATGAREIRTAFPPEQVHGVVVAYAAGVKVAFAISLATCGLGFIVSFLGGWRRLSPEAAKNAAGAA